MEKKIDIHKAGGILLNNKKFLVSRSKGKDFFIAPGGKLEKEESSINALIRELSEELSISVKEENLEKFETFYAPASGQEDKYLQMDVFLVKKWDGEIKPANEIEEIMWINSSLPAGIKLGSIFQHDVFPKLKTLGLID